MLTNDSRYQGIKRKSPEADKGVLTVPFTFGKLVQGNGVARRDEQPPRQADRATPPQMATSAGCAADSHQKGEGTDLKQMWARAAEHEQNVDLTAVDCNEQCRILEEITERRSVSTLSVGKCPKVVNAKRIHKKRQLSIDTMLSKKSSPDD